MSEDTTDWRELREFKSVDLTHSFVLAWTVESGSLLIDVDLYLCPDHVLYEEPRPAEKACFRAAFIDFPHCESATDSATAGHLADAVKKFRPGKIGGLKRTGEGRYEISGGFGTVIIRAERPMVRLKNI
jgi:hypothetical protein